MPAIRLKATSGALTGIVNTTIQDTAPAAPAGRWSPQYTLPTFMEYDAASSRVRLNAAKETEIARATNLPPTSITIADSGNAVTNYNALVAAVNAAKTTGPRHIRLANGGRFVTSAQVNLQDWAIADGAGGFKWLYIESVSIGAGTLGNEMRRAGLDDVALMAKAEAWVYNDPPFLLGKNTRNVRFGGLHFRVNPDQLATIRASSRGQPLGPTTANLPFTYIGYLGFDPMISDGNNGAIRDVGQPSGIVLDRCVLEADDQVRFVRLVLANIDKFVLRSSYLEMRGNVGESDCQAVLSVTCAGNHVIQNNAMWACNGETMMIGGGGMGGTQYFPRDYAVIDNVMGSLARWGPTQQNTLHKNHFEIKFGERICFAYNRVGPYWGYGRLGNQKFSVVVKVGPDETYATTSNVSLIGNVLADCSGGIILNGKDATANVALITAVNRIDIISNAVLPMAPTSAGYQDRALQLSGSLFGSPSGNSEGGYLRDIRLQYNSFAGIDGSGQLVYVAYSSSTASQSDAGLVLRWNISDNLLWSRQESGGFWFQAEQPGGFSSLPASWLAYIKTGTVTQRNMVVGITDPASHVVTPFGASNIGYATPAAANMSISTLVVSSGPALTAASDGGVIGVNWTTLNALLARVATGRD